MASGCTFFSSMGIAPAVDTSAVAQLDQGPVSEPSPVVTPRRTLLVRSKAVLRAAALTVTNPTMRDSLRGAGLIPISEPYGGLARFVGHAGREVIGPNVLGVLPGDKVVIDWIFLELRAVQPDGSMSAGRIGSRAALLLEDGAIVDTDGRSDVAFPGIEEGKYFLVVRHRNHLGLASAAPLTFEMGVPTVFDFSNPDSAVRGTTWTMVGPRRALIAGDANSDGKISSVQDDPVRDSSFPSLCVAMGYVDFYNPIDTNMNGNCNASDVGLSNSSPALILGGPGVLSEDL